MILNDRTLARQKYPRAWCRRKRRGNKQKVTFEILSKQRYLSKIIAISKIDEADAWAKLANPIKEDMIRLLEQ